VEQVGRGAIEDFSGKLKNRAHLGFHCRVGNGAGASDYSDRSHCSTCVRRSGGRGRGHGADSPGGGADKTREHCEFAMSCPAGRPTSLYLLATSLSSKSWMRRRWGWVATAAVTLVGIVAWPPTWFVPANDTMGKAGRLVTLSKWSPTVPPFSGGTGNGDNALAVELSIVAAATDARRPEPALGPPWAAVELGLRKDPTAAARTKRSGRSRDSNRRDLGKYSGGRSAAVSDDDSHARPPEKLVQVCLYTGGGAATDKVAAQLATFARGDPDVW
jgi:hypothetical protein